MNWHKCVVNVFADGITPLEPGAPVISVATVTAA